MFYLLMADGASGLKAISVATVTDGFWSEAAWFACEGYWEDRAGVYRPFGPFALFVVETGAFDPGKGCASPSGLKPVSIGTIANGCLV